MRGFWGCLEGSLGLVARARVLEGLGFRVCGLGFSV